MPKRQQRCVYCNNVCNKIEVSDRARRPIVVRAHSQFFRSFFFDIFSKNKMKNLHLQFYYFRPYFLKNVWKWTDLVILCNLPSMPLIAVDNRMNTYWTVERLNCNYTADGSGVSIITLVQCSRRTFSVAMSLVKKKMQRFPRVNRVFLENIFFSINICPRNRMSFILSSLAFRFARSTVLEYVPSNIARDQDLLLVKLKEYLNKNVSLMAILSK